MLVSWWVPKAFDRMGGSSLTSSFSAHAFQEILLFPSILTLFLSIFSLSSSLFSSLFPFACTIRNAVPIRDSFSDHYPLHPSSIRRQAHIFDTLNA